MADWYPQNFDAKGPWHANFSAMFATLAAKYGLTGSIGVVSKDNTWIQYWVTARMEGDTQKLALTKYINAIAGNDATLAPPNAITWAMPAGDPGQVAAPGIEFRTRQLARDIKGNAKYSVADGEALGIATNKPAEDDPDTITSQFTLRTLANFEVQADFRKRGMDALKFQFRHKGGDWHPAGFLLTSPGVLAIPPSVPGVAEQIEMRAIYMRKNAEVGNYSAAIPAFIAP